MTPRDKGQVLSLEGPVPKVAGTPAPPSTGMSCDPTVCRGLRPDEFP